MINICRSLFSLIVIFQFSTVYAESKFSQVITDDSEMTVRELVILQSVPLALQADEVRVVDGSQEALLIEVLREEGGELQKVEGIEFDKTNLNCGAQQTVVATHDLSTRYFAVTNGNGTYKIRNEIPCRGRVQLIFKSDSYGGQALGIWTVAYLAQEKMNQAVGLGFWNQSVDFVWPSDADYYNWGTVHISRGDHWDVVGHELGHAIYDLGEIGGFGGGSHKIDECYGKTLALSEGWASYFSAWLRVDPMDPDAKFEFLVPRRAPIRFEHIPSDVCEGSSNEWRVTGFFWDLYDQNLDQEDHVESFARLWTPLRGSRSASTDAARNKLERSGVPADKLEAIWKLNFIN